MEIKGYIAVDIEYGLVLTIEPLFPLSAGHCEKITIGFFSLSNFNGPLYIVMQKVIYMNNGLQIRGCNHCIISDTLLFDFIE